MPLLIADGTDGHEPTSSHAFRIQVYRERLALGTPRGTRRRPSLALLAGVRALRDLSNNRIRLSAVPRPGPDMTQCPRMASA